jgi:putative DNA primase/helicase
MNEVANFIDAINSAGLGTPDIQADGDIHRFHVEGDRAGSYNGWYSLHLDGVAAGAFGSWKIGFTETWRAESDKPITREERQRMRDEFGRAKRERHAERMMLQEEAADRALSLWSQAAEPMWHPYLKRKRVLPLGVRQKNKALVIPLFDVDGRLWSCQTIDEAGQKLFLKGGRVAVNFYLIGGPIQDEVFICEGFATGASLHMHHSDAKHKPRIWSGWR